MPKNHKKGQQSGGKVTTDDFDDMLAEFATSDLENATKTNITTTTATTTTASTISNSSTTNITTTAATTTTASTSSSSSTTSSVYGEDEEKFILKACFEGNISHLRQLKRRGFRVVSALPLVAAACENFPEIIRFLINELCAEVNQSESGGHTPLTVAVDLEHLDAMRCLVKEFGADVTLGRRSDGLTPLLLAAIKGFLDVVRCLVGELGVDVNQMDRTGGVRTTALLAAIGSGNLELVRILVKEFGADVNLVSYDGSTPLIVASHLKHEKIIKLLLKAGADAQATSVINGIHFTPAYVVACAKGPAELKEYLEAKTHCSNRKCSGAGIRKCTGCKQARYCGQACQLAHWPAHKAECKVRQAKASSAE
jgi:ankyrin repeat protein